ncbi:MAG: iron ABC transporter permease [Oscillospiraceae bacterium]|nr:iron ABC transporter permease [Oscillospiraceae bacterium]
MGKGIQPAARKLAADYSRSTRRKWLVLLALALAMLGSALASLAVGSSGLSVAEMLAALVGRGGRQASLIVWNVRLPRAAAGAAVGAALAMGGCVMQSVLRNPLASASTLGVTQGASFGAAAAIVWLGAGIQVSGAAAGVTITNPALVTICAFVGGAATTLVILGLARLRGVTPSVMVLAGTAVSALFTGATTLIQYFCDDVMVATIVYWTFGSLGRAGWGEIGLVALLSALAFLFFFINRWNYNALEGGMRTAQSLGVAVKRLILLSMVLCALVSSAATAFVGCISFIGLIAPHMVRRFTGSDYRFLIPGSALMGAVLLLLSDIVSRTMLMPAVLPIGALTSFLGAPLFLWLIVRRGGGTL